MFWSLALNKKAKRSFEYSVSTCYMFAIAWHQTKYPTFLELCLPTKSQFEKVTRCLSRSRCFQEGKKRSRRFATANVIIEYYLCPMNILHCVLSDLLQPWHRTRKALQTEDGCEDAATETVWSDFVVVFQLIVNLLQWIYNKENSNWNYKGEYTTDEMFRWKWG